MSSELNLPSQDFIDENKKLCQTMPKPHKSGRYPQHEKENRRNEVYRLHFEYGYSARKISELMNINRNTINGDINYWYAKVVNKAELSDPEYWIVRKIERFEIQRTRIRERIDKTQNFQEYYSLERLLFDIESKIIMIQLKLVNSAVSEYNNARKHFNEWLENKGHKERYLTLYDLIRVSNEAMTRISQIIEEDKKRGMR